MKDIYTKESRRKVAQLQFKQMFKSTFYLFNIPIAFFTFIFSAGFDSFLIAGIGLSIIFLITIFLFFVEKTVANDYIYLKNENSLRLLSENITKDLEEIMQVLANSWYDYPRYLSNYPSKELEKIYKEKQNLFSELKEILDFVSLIPLSNQKLFVLTFEEKLYPLIKNKEFITSNFKIKLYELENLKTFHIISDRIHLAHEVILSSNEQENKNLFQFQLDTVFYENYLQLKKEKEEFKNQRIKENKIDVELDDVFKKILY